MDKHEKDGSTRPGRDSSEGYSLYLILEKTAVVTACVRKRSGTQTKHALAFLPLMDRRPNGDVEGILKIDPQATHQPASHITIAIPDVVAGETLP